MAKLISQTHLLKKLKIIVAAAFVATLLVASLGAYGLYVGYQSLAANTSEINVAEQAEAIRLEAQKYIAPPAGCWAQIQALLDFQPWLNNPIGQNMNSLKTACLAQQTQ